MPLILVIIGITGDLAKRKLLPAVEAIAAADAFPKKWKVLGTSRREVTTETLLRIGEHLEVMQVDMDDAAGYTQLAQKLNEIESEFGSPAQRLFYMSVPPSAVASIIEKLGASGLASVANTKLLLEKPFGTDLASATELVAHIDQHFTEEQVYRIDHYLAKQMAQNMIVFRESNALFRKTWNNTFIERIEIHANEMIGIEGRAHFYEQTGALRDVVQSHLLQLAALTLMSPLGSDELETVPKRRLTILESLSLSSSVPTRRGQYEGYRAEVANEASTVETYVDLTLESNLPQWVGVPIRLVTGKMLHEKKTEIRIFYKKDAAEEANELVLRLQPNEGIALSMWAKRPGYAAEIEKQTLDFTYAAHYAALPDAYEKVLVDVTHSDHDLFVSSGEVLASWRIIAPLQARWAASSDDLFFYKPGVNPAS